MPVSVKAPPSPRRSVLTDETYEMIRNLILDHQIPPGAKVNIDALATRLKVSQTPIRESLARLESERLITKVALKGYTTTGLLTMEEFRDLYQLRLLIEPWAAGETASRLDEMGKDELQAEMKRAHAVLKFTNVEHVHLLTEHDTRFHSLISNMSGNSSVNEAFNQMHCHLHLFRLYLATKNREVENKNSAEFFKDLAEGIFNPETAKITINEHAVITAAIIQGDSKKAYSAMQSHIKSSMKRFSPAAKVANTKKGKK
jgi:DNA-binding GntR family transcriptional regulator